MVPPGDGASEGEEDGGGGNADGNTSAGPGARAGALAASLAALHSIADPSVAHGAVIVQADESLHGWEDTPAGRTVGRLLAARGCVACGHHRYHGTLRTVKHHAEWRAVSCLLHAYSVCACWVAMLLVACAWCHRRRHITTLAEFTNLDNILAQAALSPGLSSVFEKARCLSLT